MRDDQYADFSRIMARAATLTYRQKGTDFNELVLVLFEELAPMYELQDIANAVAHHVRLEKFFPTLADIVTRIEGTPGNRAALAWRLVVDAIRHIGSSNSVVFPSPAYNYALDQMGGWRKLCATLTDEEIPWRGKDFERFFEIGETCATWEHEPGKIHVERYCIGTFEVNNRAQGYALPDVIDAETRKPIPGLRAALPAPNRDVDSLLKLVGGKRAS